MHTVIESMEYLRKAKAVGMTLPEMEAAVTLVASDPLAGELIIGTRGFRKLRLAGRGHGKSGGYRLITYFFNGEAPVVLVTMFSKGEKPNLSKAERNGLAASEPRLRASLIGG